MILNKKLENYWLILQSLPSWECGLKLFGNETKILQAKVAPFVGVWIEIIAGQDLAGNVLGRSLRGSVD